MKAFFSRLHIGSSTKEKDRDIPIAQKEKFPPLRSWPPEQPQRSTSTPASYTSTAFKPLPELVPTFSSKTQDDSPSSSSTPTPPYSSPTPTPTPRANGAASPPPGRSNSPRADPDSTGRSSRKTNTSVATATASDVQKKVAFKSPPPTPSNLDRTLPEAPANASGSGVPLKTSVSRFQAAHGTSSKEPRGSTSTGASSSKTDLASSAKTAVKSTSTRTGSPYLQKIGEAGSSQSLRSGTPYSSMSNTTSGSRILAAQSWSEVTEEDLVSNIGSRERTRQEVLFEIISSEERYVQELVKMKDTFIDPLLHPFSAPTPQQSSTPHLDYDYYRSDSPAESNDNLPPIAARFMSPSPHPESSPSSQSHKDTTPNIDGESLDTDEEDEGVDQLGKGYALSGRQLAKQNHPRSPYRSNGTTNKPAGKSVPFPTRSHHSLPPPPRANQLNGSTHSLGRQSSVVERERNYSQGQSSMAKPNSPKPGMLRKFKKSQTTNDSIFGTAVAPHQLPEDLRICLEVVDSGVFDGHKRLSEALKKRYDDQFPLVRSLADVFVSNSDIFHGYATYVLHLERALEQVDDALSNITTKKPKKQDVGEWQKVCKFLQKLEENASEKGETGLAITLSKPFQRLLKYPLLFQNLLFHTDPSTFEYESTLQMVAEVETIVRSIEDEKIQKEERDKTRDVFARIEGLDKVRQLALPKPSRVLIEERQCTPGASGLSPSKPSSPPPVMGNKGVRGKSSFKRLSDVLHTGSGIGGKKDLWFVVFNDVVLQCQRTGTTSLPLVAATYSRTNSLPELQGRSKYATTGRRNSHTKPRNLYKFLKIETWAIGDVVQPREGVVSMEDVARSRAQVHTNQPRIVPLPDDDEDGGIDSDDSDRKSKMSFSYWGADKITVQKPIIKGRIGPTPRRGGSGSSYGRESSANAKFGTRLVSGDTSPTPRPASRRTQAGTPTSRRAGASDDSNVNYAKSTVTPARPEWNTSTRSPVPGAAVAKRTRNISQTSAAVSSTRLANAKGLASPAPSEDSGVGLYRQMLAQDPSLNHT